MDGAGTRMRRGFLRRWSCAGLSWKTHRSTSALYCPRTALFARHDRLLGECHGRPAFLCGQLRRRSRITECVARADCATAQSRCAIVFDREGYSPRFFAQMKEERIAILTYHKFPGELWPEQEFRTHKVSLVNGEQVSLELAERGVRLSNDLWVREVRHLSEKGHQSSILSTDYHSDLTRVAVAMFARWCQEIFFKYMRQHYNLDRLIEYQTEPIPDTTRVINPAWRQLDSQIRRQNGLLNRELLQFAQIQLPQEMEPQQVETYQRKKGQLQQAIEERRPQIEQLKAQRKALLKHIQIKDLPEQDRFHRLRSEKKHFIDTIKLIAYRAETALAQLAREKLKRLDDARSLIRQLFRTEVDLVPDQQNKTLTVRLHPMSTQAHDEIVRHLCV